MKLLLLILAAPFVGALSTYIGGRILLPEMGLAAPSYWVWFVANLLLSVGPLWAVWIRREMVRTLLAR